MPRAYFGSRISDHILKTPEGFLVCKDVPIARTGIQEYRGAEFGAQDSERVYDVQRPESEVFDRAAVASFEGKPVCDEHPPEDVTPDNFTRYIKGVCRDVRRGDGDLRNCLVADLLIYDADLIKKIEGAIAALSAPKQQEAPKPEPDALDALEEELQRPAPTSDEDDVVAAPEEINAQDAIEEPEAEAAGAPVPASAEARDAAMAIIRSLRPAIASLPAAKRKRAADSLATLIKGNIAYVSQYGELLILLQTMIQTNLEDSLVMQGSLLRLVVNMVVTTLTIRT